MIKYYKGEGYGYWFNYKTANSNTSLFKLLIRDLIQIVRVLFQRNWFKLFPKKQVTQEEMCNHFCYLPDNIKVFINDNWRYGQGKIASELDYINSQITIKENGN